MHFVQRMTRGGRAACWILCVTLLVGCGNHPEGIDPDGNEYVQYKGTALVVEGNAFAREATLDPPGPLLPGRVVVKPDDDNKDDALVLIERYGLPLEGRSREGWLLVKVPSGFETQWAAALASQLGGRSTATTDSATAATAVVPDVAKSSNAPVVAGASVPDEEPSAEDVRRLFIEQYERLERAGGLPATVTATGQSMVLHSKVFDARKESCHRLPGAEPGEWECEAELMMGLCSGDCDPSAEEPLPKGERLDIRWDSTHRRFTLDD